MRFPLLAAPAVLLAAACVAVLPGAVLPGAAQPPIGAPVPVAALSYADIADLVIASPVVIDAIIVSTSRIKGPEAASVPPGFTRFYVEADAAALIRAPGAIPPRVGYLLDVAPDAAGRLPKLKKARVLLFARSAGGGATQIQLVRPDAQRLWTPDADVLVRRIVKEIVSRDAPPVVTGVGNAFHVPGSLPGEGETQLFLTTEDHRPVSLSILRRPGEQPRWAVALSEIVDDAAAPVQRDTLLWYRLACALPPTLPASSAASLEPENADLARADYAFVIEQLGPCDRPVPR